MLLAAEEQKGSPSPKTKSKHLPTLRSEDEPCQGLSCLCYTRARPGASQKPRQCSCYICSAVAQGPSRGLAGGNRGSGREAGVSHPTHRVYTHPLVFDGKIHRTNNTRPVLRGQPRKCAHGKPGLCPRLPRED